eukprot:sb/3466151/
MLIWEERYGEKARDHVRFVDIGCGNGLLVYLLTQEGYTGLGIDVRARNIWTSTFSNCSYRESYFDPKEFESIRGYNWILGNHSDELTPWLPYVASQLTPCDFFLLPCCTWNFTARFERKNNKLSVYQDYLNYIEWVIVEIGFSFERDVMRIPSTKRTCFVSNGGCPDLVTRGAGVVQKHCQTTRGGSIVERKWDIPVTNGTKVDRELCNRIVDCAASYLLRNVSSDKESGPFQKGKEWSAGESAPFPELITHIRDNEVEFSAELRQQNGGIQTVLRNCHQVFSIRNGVVSIRDWREGDGGGRKRRKGMANKKYDSTALAKTKRCWFYDNHPQGCPIEGTCNYAHGETELVRVT